MKNDIKYHIIQAKIKSLLKHSGNLLLSLEMQVIAAHLEIPFASDSKAIEKCSVCHQ